MNKTSFVSTAVFASSSTVYADHYASIIIIITIMTSLTTQDLHCSTFLIKRQLFGELDIELHDQVATLAWLAADGHTLSCNHAPSLRGNDFVEVQVHQLAVELFLSGTWDTIVIDFASKASIRDTQAV